MVDFTESMLGIASPSVGAGTVPSAGFTTMVNVVRGASGLSAHALPADDTRPAARASADAPAMVRTSRTELMSLFRKCDGVKRTGYLNPFDFENQGLLRVIAGSGGSRARPLRG